ncbi:hypothetical protein LY76DRAFT_403619 [Colletotrichum caudatum]|nr:hypothetical protein LY76DRAFT_403619 [Colletotrichum caudatum]
MLVVGWILWQWTQRRGGGTLREKGVAFSGQRRRRRRRRRVVGLVVVCSGGSSSGGEGGCCPIQVETGNRRERERRRRGGRGCRQRLIALGSGRVGSGQVKQGSWADE